MPKVTETRTQDHLREKVTHLNLADYLCDLEAIAKEAGEFDNLKINYVMNYENVSRYELHRLHAIECILRYVASSFHRHLPLSSISLCVCNECFEFTFVLCRYTYIKAERRR